MIYDPPSVGTAVVYGLLAVVALVVVIALVAWTCGGRGR